MYNWKVEECKLMNENINKGTEKYKCEYGLTPEEKIAFIDNMNEGKLSDFLKLKQKLNKDIELDYLKIDNLGYVKGNSLKAWLRRNDTKNIIDKDINIGEFFLLGSIYHLNSSLSSIDIINKLFHKQLEYCESMEKEWFKNHDKYSILCNKVKKYIKEYNTDFGLNLIISEYIKISKNDDDYFEGRKLTIDELKKLLSAYEKLENYKNLISKEINIKY